MIEVLLYKTIPSDKSPFLVKIVMLANIAAYRIWLRDNNIVASVNVERLSIDFMSEEDAIAFKLKFGL